MEHCLYCFAEVADHEPIPAVDDDEGWYALALDHTEQCEWILTRAHQLTQYS